MRSIFTYNQENGEKSIMTIYKCPSCNAPMVYNSATRQLTCEYCNTKVPIEEADRLKTESKETADDFQYEVNESQTQQNDASGAQNAQKTVNYKMYKCPSCGAEILTDENTAATFCSFCQSPTLIEDKLTGALAPSRIIAFKNNKEMAKSAYLQWTKSGHFVPKEFSKSSVIDKITGIYVPFWLYDYDTVSDIDADATKVRSEVRGDTRYTHTDHYKVHRTVQAEFDKVPADASEQMEDSVMDILEPFTYSELTDFDMSYLSGFYAEKFNYTSDEMKARIECRIKKYAKDTALSTINGYSSKTIVHENYNMIQKKSEYVMLPVWVLNYRYKNKEFKFTMNGQTGKIVGALPVSKGKMAGTFLGLTAGIFIILHLIFSVLM